MSRSNLATWILAMLLILSAHEALALTISLNYSILQDPSAVVGLAYSGTHVQGIAGNQIVGYYDGPDNRNHGFLFNGTSWTTLDDPAASQNYGTYAEGVLGNQIVGYTRDSAGNYHGFLYNGASYIVLDDPFAKTTSTFIGGTVPRGIFNNKVIGNHIGGTTPAGGFTYDLTTHVWTDLNDPAASGGNTFVEGVNPTNGDLVGWYQATSQSSPHSFLFDGTHWTTLDDPQAFFGTEAYAASGTSVVGQFTGVSSGYLGFDFSGTSWTTIDPPSASLSQGGTNIVGISGSRLVGYYYDSNANLVSFVASIPEPSSLILFSIGAVVTGGAAIYRRLCAAVAGGRFERIVALGGRSNSVRAGGENRCVLKTHALS